MSDLIERQAAIDAAECIVEHHSITPYKTMAAAMDHLKRILNGMPSAQPETHDKRTETNACDLIDRQAAIDALEWGITYAKAINKETGEMRELFAESNDELRKAVDRVKALPSTQPQSCKDAVSKADVLETYAELYDVFDDNKEIKNELHKIYDKINALQAAQPQRIKGRWVRKESDLSWWYECSECGESPLFDPYENEVRTPFCPWCGAEMEVE